MNGKICERIGLLIVVVAGLFLITAGMGLIIFGEPTVMTFGNSIPGREAVIIQYDLYLDFGWRIIIAGAAALSTSVLLSFDELTDNNPKLSKIKA